MNEKEGYVPIEAILHLIEKHLKQCSSGERLRFALGISKIIGDMDIAEPTAEPEPTKSKMTVEPKPTESKLGPDGLRAAKALKQIGKKRKVNLV